MSSPESAAPTAPTADPAPAAKMVTLEVGGSKKRCKPTRIPGALVVRCTDLPNPHQAIGNGRLQPRFRPLLKWMQKATPESAMKMQLRATHVANKLIAGNDVRVQCLGGRHRSQVIARLALGLLSEEDRRRVNVEYLDAAPLE